MLESRNLPLHSDFNHISHFPFPPSLFEEKFHIILLTTMNGHVERWGPALQERTRRTTAKRPIPKASSLGVDFNKLAPTSVPLRQAQPVAKNQQQAASLYCRLSALSSTEAGPVETLAQRYLAGALQHPTLKQLQETRGAEVAFDITGIDRIDSSATASASEWGNKRGLVVKKVLPHVDMAELRKYGGHLTAQGDNVTSREADMSSWLTAKLPHVHGFYFSNIYPASSSPDGDDDGVVSLMERALVSSSAGGGVDGEGTMLLCNVAVGRMCMNDRGVMDVVLQTAHTLQSNGASPSEICQGLKGALGTTEPSTSPAITAPHSRPSTSQGMTRASKGTAAAADGGGGHAVDTAGYDSLVCSVDGTPNTLVFDSTRIVPTHVIHFKCKVTELPPPSATKQHPNDDERQGHRRPGTAMSNSSPPSHWGSRPSSQLQRPATALSPTRSHPGSRLGTRSNQHQGGDHHNGGRHAALNALKDDIRRSSHAASAHIRQQCKDLIDALCAKREAILASVRTQEEALLRDVTDLEQEAVDEEGPSNGFAQRQTSLSNAASQLRGLRISVVDSMREINRLSIVELRRESFKQTPSTPQHPVVSDPVQHTVELHRNDPPTYVPSSRPQTSPTPYSNAGGADHHHPINNVASRRANQATAALNGRLRKPPLAASETVRKHPSNTHGSTIAHV